MSGFKVSVGVLAAWVLLGLFGHDPWKPDEAYTFGLVYHILQSGDWVVPTLGGEPFMEKPPLYFVTAALFAKAFGWLLPLHDAARLASAFYVALTLLCAGLAARSIAAPLLLVACLGYAHHAHQLITDTALVAGIAAGLLGFSKIHEKPGLGGLLLGTGVGIAFMSKGLLGPGLLGLTAVALLVFPAWRTRDTLRSWGWALLAFAPWALIWPWLLYREAPGLFNEWLWVQNLGRFTGKHEIGGTPDHWHYVKALPWFAFPAWLLAAWVVFSRRKEIFLKTELQLPLTAFLVMFAVLSASSLARQVYALPMLVPLCLLAAAGVASAPAWLRVPLDKLAVWGAAAAGLSLWALWFSFFGGWPARLAAEAPGFVHRVEPLWLALGIVTTALWIYLVRIQDLAIRFAAASLLVWGLVMTLWLPYLDYAKSYRGVIADMQRHRPEGCVATFDLTEPQRAVFHYFAGISKSDARGCRLLLVHTSSRKPPLVDPRWSLLWQGGRPGDERERFWLFTSSARPPGRP